MALQYVTSLTFNTLIVHRVARQACCLYPPRTATLLPFITTTMVKMQLYDPCKAHHG